MPRTCCLNRDTNETKIQVSINLDGGDLSPYEHSDFWAAFDKENLNGEGEKVDKDHARWLESAHKVQGRPPH